MYCLVEMMSPFLIFDVKGMHRKRAYSVSPTMLYSTISLYIIKVCIRTMSKGNLGKSGPAPLMKTPIP